MANKIETQVDCPVCGETHFTRSRFTITTHAKEAHNLEPVEIYKLYNKIDKFICKQCGCEHTKFKSFCVGHGDFCGLSCAQKFNRANRSPEAEQVFRQKLSVAVANEWATNDQTARINNISASVNRAVSLMTDEERKEKFGWLSKLSDDDKRKFIDSVMLNTGAHLWKKTASSEELEAMYERRAKTLGDTWSERGSEIIQKQNATFLKNKPASGNWCDADEEPLDDRLLKIIGAL